MIHLVVREALAYKRTLCQALSDSYKGSFVAWFAGKDEPLIPQAGETFTRRLISDVGYATLYRELRSDPQAIVILGSWSSAFALKTLLITQLLHIPVFIWTDHPHPRQRSWVFDRLRKMYLRLLAKRVSGFLACGKPTVSHLESLGVASAKITNFPYWVSIPEEWSLPERCKENRNSKPLHLIAIGRHVAVKAFEVAIEAVALANQRAGHHVATLEVIGDGPERTRLEAWARSLNLGDVAKFPGWLSNDAVRKRIQESDALVVTSKFEPYGVVVLEGLASGRPILASDGVIAALDRDDGFGAILFHPAGDAEFLAQQIKLLAGETERCENGFRSCPGKCRRVASDPCGSDSTAGFRPCDSRQNTGNCCRTELRATMNREAFSRSVMIERYSRVLFRWRARSAHRSRIGPPRVTIVQWVLAAVSVVIAGLSYEIRSYVWLAGMTQVLVLLSFVSLIIVTREVFRKGSIGKFCLVAGVFVFYWIDAFALSLQRYPFAVPETFPYGATQFDQSLIQQALVYVSVFQLMLLVGHSIRPRLDRQMKFLVERVDSVSFDRTLVAFLLIMCSFTPLVVFYDFDIFKIVAALLASRTGTDFESPEPGLAQHVSLFGVYGASLGFVYALKAATWRRFWWLAMGFIAALPFVLGGTRHIWLYISLPSVLIVLRGFKGVMSHKRVVGLTTVALVVLVIAQAQFVYRSVGWKGVSDVPTEELSQVNTNGQLTALLFAEHLVPGQHEYFEELAEPYFLIHWVPRQIWPHKPVMESWTYYNDSYTQGAAFNVTPSVIGQFHLNWGLPGVMFIGTWLGFLTLTADRLLLMLDSSRQRAMFVVVGMFYAFIISSFRFYSPIYFSYFCFGLLAMFLLTRRRVPAPAAVPLRTHQLPA